MSSGIVAVLPGDGWFCEWGVKGQGTVDTPVIGWAVHADGAVAALVMIGGTVTRVLRSEVSLRLYHPAESGTDPDDE